MNKALASIGHRNYLVHTGQHYDYGMSQVFFDELQIPQPDVNLGIGSGTHGWQTGQMLMHIEQVLLAEKPDCALVYGDTNSTLAGALAAVKLHLPLAHVEAGLRSYNREMPEEHNRVLADHCADLLFCPTQTAIDNLAKEGITRGVHWVGDTMYDAVLQFSELAREHSMILQRLGIEPESYILATLHRPYNTDNPQILSSIWSALLQMGEPVVFPVHPRTRQALERLGPVSPAESCVHLIEPVGYLDMLWLEQNARLIMTDSGGVQKEAYFFAVPCITLRPETEWVETVQQGWNLLVGSDQELILRAASTFKPRQARPAAIFGDGKAAEKIVWHLDRAFSSQ